MKGFFLVITVLLCSCLGVHRENFRTCQDSGFCKRHRNVAPGASSYVVQPSSLRLSKTSFMVDVVNTENNVKFLLQGYGLTNGMFRVKFLEADPIRERYEIPVGITLISDPTQEEIVYGGDEDGKLTFTMGDNKMVVVVKPLRLDFMIKDETVTSLNAQGLLKFEHSRKREPAKDDESAGDGAQEEEKEAEEKVEETEESQPTNNEEPGMWEETFKGHTDSKPNGPVSVGIDIAFPGFRYVYGIPEHADSFALKTTANTDPYRLYNLDVFEYELYNPMALYGHIPYMVAHNEKNTVGIFFQNAAEGWVDVRSNVADKSVFSNLADFVTGKQEVPQTDTHWYFEDGIIDIFVLLGSEPKRVFKQYASLTGSTPLPPLWSLAYHQCRWNYNDQDDVRTVDATMDKFDIPFDVIWLDIEHTNGKRYFTWDGHRFSNSIEMLRNLTSKGRKMVTIVDPHLKRDDNYAVYTDARDKRLLVKNKDNNDFDGWCWPGSSSWPDFMEEKVQQWWADQFAYDKYVGTAENLFVWNDMNEPSVFNSPEITFPKDALHLSGRENREVHNVYGMLVHKATWDGLLKRSNYRERPFVLTRAFFAGSQRYGAVWTGDNTGEWGHLKATVPMMLSLNLAGITFSGADVGGFFKNPDNELLTRWYQAAVFQPFMRAHAHIDTKRREPYLLPEDLMIIVRDAVKKRYSYLPLWYTLFHESELDGMPVMRSLWMEFPGDSELFEKDDIYLLGDSLLVRPVVDQGAKTANVYFPGKNTIWYDVDTYKPYLGGQELIVDAPLDKTPAYQRGGSIIPRKMRARRAASLMYNDPITLVICLNQQHTAKGDLYLDDYHSFKYQQGFFAMMTITFKNYKLESTVVHKGDGFKTKEWLERVIIAGVVTEPKAIHVLKDGESQGKVVEHEYNAESKVLTIRKPGVNMAEHWIINLH